MKIHLRAEERNGFFDSRRINTGSLTALNNEIGAEANIDCLLPLSLFRRAGTGGELDLAAVGTSGDDGVTTSSSSSGSSAASLPRSAGLAASGGGDGGG